MNRYFSCVSQNFLSTTFHNILILIQVSARNISFLNEASLVGPINPKLTETGTSPCSNERNHYFKFIVSSEGLKKMKTTKVSVLAVRFFFSGGHRGKWQQFILIKTVERSEQQKVNLERALKTKS